MRPCRNCGNAFPIGSRERRKQLYCGAKCAEQYRRRRRKASRLAAGGTEGRTRSRVWFQTCWCCERPYVARTARTLFCSDTCRRSVRATLARQAYDADRAAGAEVGRLRRLRLTPEQREQRLATERLRTARVGYTNTKREADARRRAAKLNAITERFDRREVFDRDRWCCGICGLKVDDKLTFPHPRSATIDHVIPLSHGGDHTRANTRPAHLYCNVSRSNRGGPEQLALLG
jgi:5-methylcytosine-specific restriction endonuclease McrA